MPGGSVVGGASIGAWLAHGGSSLGGISVRTWPMLVMLWPGGGSFTQYLSRYCIFVGIYSIC